MMPTPKADALIEAISALALDIAAHCPDCADKATRLGALVGQLQQVSVDRGAIQDALETEALDTDMSDLRVRSAAEAVVRSTRDEG